MATLNVHAAKTQLSRLIDRAARGEDIVIARGGKPVARLTALAPVSPRRPGLLKGRLRMAADFDAPLPANTLAAFVSGDIEPASLVAKATKKQRTIRRTRSTT
jgi:prevent-host-death family protein